MIRHMNAAKLLATGLAFTMLLAAGCGNGEDADRSGDEAKAKQDGSQVEPFTGTPEEQIRQTLKQFAADLEAGNAAGVMARLDAPEEVKQFLGTTVKMEKVRKGFTAKLDEAYGEGSAQELFEGSPMGGPGGMKSNVSEMTEKIDDAEIEVDGDTAVVRVPGEEDPMPMVLKDGIWKVNMPADEMPTEPQAMEMMSVLAISMEGMVEVMEQTAPQIGQVDKAAFKAEFQQAAQNNEKVGKMREFMMKAMAESMRESATQPPAPGEMPTEPNAPAGE